MCDNRDCEHPERLKVKTGECSAEQIFLCHGIVKDESEKSKDK